MDMLTKLMQKILVFKIKIKWWIYLIFYFCRQNKEYWKFCNSLKEILAVAKITKLLILIWVCSIIFNLPLLNVFYEFSDQKIPTVSSFRSSIISRLKMKTVLIILEHELTSFFCSGVWQRERRKKDELQHSKLFCCSIFGSIIGTYAE